MRLSSGAALLLLGGNGCHAFVLSPFGVQRPSTSSSGSFHSTTSTRLYYIDEERSNDNKNNNNNNNSNNQNQNDSKQAGENADPVLTIPVLGPIPGNKPLVVGGELVLAVPTPLQWYTLEESMNLHQAHLLAKESGVAGIDSAPLVAILDDYTATTNTNKGGGRYATIAAVLGVSTRPNQKRLDLSDSSTFMESLSRIQRESTPQEGNIRLLGIGRAKVYDYVYQVPSCVSCSKNNNGMDEDGNLLLDDDKYYDDEDYYYEEDDDEDDDDDADVQDDECCGEDAIEDEIPNIVMAKFKLITDGTEHSQGFLNKGMDGGQRYGGQRSRFSSPMHALREMASLSMKLHYLHQDRIKLVSGIKAARIRYQRRTKRQEKEKATSTAAVVEDEDDLEDYDGFGALFAQKELENTQPAMEQFLAEFASSSDSSPAPLLPPTNTTSSDIDFMKLSKKNNYGMGLSSSSMSSINDLAKAYLEKLAPYYSPSLRDTEEFQYEVLSFVAVLALSDFVEPKDLGWALCWRNTQERLQQAYDWMWNHVRLLRQDAQELSQRLLDCGEECTDLF